MTSYLLLLALCVAPARATVIFNNTGNDTGFVDTFFDNNLTEAGDQILLAGSERQVRRVQLRLSNLAASTGAADISLRFYGVAAGNTLGSLIGTPTTLNAVNFGANSTRTVDFLLNVLLPDEVIWTVTLANSGSLILGLNIFNPPTVGSSSANSYWWNQGAGLALTASGFGSDNYYFLADTAEGALPAEPRSVALLAAGALVLSMRRWLAKP